MSAATVSMDSPIHLRLLAWMDERFPLANGLLFISIYLATAAYSRFLFDEGALSISLIDLINCLVCWSFFLILRIFDEHKDYELDVKNHPDRVLQSGLITLKHLKLAAVACIALQVIWSLTLDSGSGQTFSAWLVMFAWTCLMGKEFFCGEWLEKRLVLYAFSHMLVMGLIIWWLANLASAHAALTLEISYLMAFAFFSGFAFEITRKTRGPEEERDTVDSYSKIFGATGSAAIILVLLAIITTLQIILLNSISSDIYWTGIFISALAYAFAFKSVISFISKPSLEGREKNEKSVAIAMLSSYWVVLSAVIIDRGVNFALI